MQAVIGQKLIGSLKVDAKPYEIRDTRTNGFILRVQPSGVMSYIAEYGRGKRITIGRVGVLTPAQARERAQDILADAIKGADPQEAKRKAKAHTLESYVLGVYMPWCQIHHRDPRTIGRIKTGFLPTFGKDNLADISAWKIEKWRSGRLKDGASKSTVNRDIAALKAALRRAGDWGYLESNPLTTIKQIKTDSKAVIRFLTDDEEDRLRAALDAREARIRQERANANAWRAERGYKLLPTLAGGFADHIKPMVILSLNTGLRRGELFNLAPADADLERALLTVRGSGAKSGQTRHIPLNDEALDVLKTWQSKGELVFPGRNGERLDNVNSAWRRLMKEAGITRFRWHDLRHTFASRLAIAGVDLNIIRELLGHASYAMTLRYSHLSPEVKAAAVQRLVRTQGKKLTALKS